MTVEIIAALSLMVVSLLGLAASAWVLFNPTRSVTDRMDDFIGEAKDVAAEIFVQKAPPPKLADSIAKLAAGGTPDEVSDQRKTMIQAGFRQPYALETYLAVRVVLSLTLPIVCYVASRPDKLIYIALVVLVGASLGYYAPAIYVGFKRGKRVDAFNKNLPNCLDMLVSCTESGLGLDASLERVTREMESVAPELVQELEIFNHEVGAGLARTDALRRLDTRTNVPSLNSLVNVLIQADRFGTPVSAALRAHATFMRTKRTLQAEEQAAKISPKMTVAMVLFLLPPLFLVILGPAVINIIRILMPTLMSGGSR